MRNEELLSEVVKQASVGCFNRRVAREAQNGNSMFIIDRLGGSPVAEFLCTCGREDCDEIITLSVDEYRFVRERPYRFLVASGHATDADDVVVSAGEYDVVEVKPPYRDSATALTE